MAKAVLYSVRSNLTTAIDESVGHDFMEHASRCISDAGVQLVCSTPNLVAFPLTWAPLEPHTSKNDSKVTK